MQYLPSRAPSFFGGVGTVADRRASARARIGNRRVYFIIVEEAVIGGLMTILLQKFVVTSYRIDLLG